MNKNIISPNGLTLLTAGKYCNQNIKVIPVLQEKATTENGDIVADNGYAGLSKVTVNVPTADFEIYDGAYNEVIVYPFSYRLLDDQASYAVVGIGSVTDTDIIIPDTYKGLPVTQVSYPYTGAFANNTKITSVIIGNNVTTIAQNSFKSCTNLKQLTMSDSVTDILGSAFESCTGLTRVTFSANLKNIGGYAFYSCKNLKLYDFRKAKVVPTLYSNSDLYGGVYTGVQMVVPDELYDSWMTSPRWVDYKTNIVKASAYTGT